MPRRPTALLVLTTLLLTLALPGLAQEEGAGDETTSDTAAEVTVATPAVKTPAVTVAPEPPPDITQPWTSKFLIPTGLVLGAVVVLLTVVQYFLRVVRTRYKVVE